MAFTLLREQNTPRWIIFMIDIMICAFSLSLAYLLRFNFNIPEKESSTFYYVFPSILGLRALTFYFSKIYAGIIRYTSTTDAQRIFNVVTAGTGVFCVVNLVRYYGIDYKFHMPFSVVVIDYFATTFFMIALRIAVKVFYFEMKNPSKEKSNVIIFGAGDSGVITKRALDRDAGTKYKVIAFLDDNSRLAGKKIEGVKIHKTEDLNDLLIDNEVLQVVISIQNLGAERKRHIVEKCLQHNVTVFNVPPVLNWINGELSFNQIRNVRIEDLLGRDSIKLDKKNIGAQIKDQVVLVSGAAGSIGSELVRQISYFNPKRLILLDQAESPMYELEFELQQKGWRDNCEIVIGDIRHRERLNNMFNTFKPNIVYHAAAYKHVPMMEDNPSEAIRTNVLGTKHMVDLAIEHQVTTFVMVSTDKAVNPTNVMGASKRMAEIYAQAVNKSSKTNFITTRFGNVLGSNGSVIPLFKKQIAQGGPITVTDPKITRFFMTIPEACQLVLEAGAMGSGGEIYVFDMGKSVKILDLAKKMVKLSGLELGKDIEIKFTGLRPGEKLYEELLANEENTQPTHHPQIMIGKVREYELEYVKKEIEELTSLYEKQDNESIVGKLKSIIHEYQSQNSVYERLDVDK